MTAYSPFSNRSRPSNDDVAGKWSLDPTHPDPQGDRLQRYCDEMNRRDPYRRHWFINSFTNNEGQPTRFVDNKVRDHGRNS